MVGRGTVAGDRVEDLKLGLVEGSAECRLQNHEPGASGVDVAEARLFYKGPLLFPSK
jgi:hypothetical protein